MISLRSPRASIQLLVLWQLPSFRFMFRGFEYFNVLMHPISSSSRLINIWLAITRATPFRADSLLVMDLHFQLVA